MTITVIGLPAPQGSKSFRGVSKAGHGIMVESSRHVKPWRDSVIVAAREVMIKGGLTAPAFRGPVNVCVTFSLPKPKSAQKRRASYPDRKPDIDKLLRSTFDGLSSAGVWEDDARVVSVCAYKVFAGEDELDFPGALIGIHLSGGAYRDSRGVMNQTRAASQRDHRSKRGPLALEHG